MEWFMHLSSTFPPFGCPVLSPLYAFIRSDFCAWSLSSLSVYIDALINPIAYLSEQEKHSQQLAVLEDSEFVSVSLSTICVCIQIRGRSNYFENPVLNYFWLQQYMKFSNMIKRDLNSNWICSWVWRYNVSSNINNDRENRIIENTMNESYLRIFYVSKVKDPEHVF